MSQEDMLFKEMSLQQISIEEMSQQQMPLEETLWRQGWWFLPFGLSLFGKKNSHNSKFLKCSEGRRDIQQNDTQHNGTQCSIKKFNTVKI